MKSFSKPRPSFLLCGLPDGGAPLLLLFLLSLATAKTTTAGQPIVNQTLVVNPTMVEVKHHDDDAPSRTSLRGRDRRLAKRYMNSDQKTRLTLQHRIGEDRALYHSDFVGTHNSYCNDGHDGKCNTRPNNGVRQWAQLEHGFRLINWDIHYKPNRNGPVLCHYFNNAEGTSECNKSSSSRMLKNVAEEFVDWLDQHPDDFIIVIIEKKFKDSRNQAVINVLENKLGSRIFRPLDYTSGGSTCLFSDIFQDPGITKRGLLTGTTNKVDRNRNKRILFATTTGNDGGSCTYGSAPWRRYVWEMEIAIGDGDKGGSHRKSVFGYNEGDLPSSYAVTTYENRGYGGGGANSVIDKNEARRIIQNGVHMVGLDYALDDRGTNEEERMESFIWSWNPGFPRDSGSKRCAIQGRGMGRWNNYDCDNRRRVACRRYNLKKDWRVTTAAYQFQGARQACQDEFGPTYFFDVPTNGNYNYQLLQSWPTGSFNQIWIAYQYDGSRWKDVGGP